MITFPSWAEAGPFIAYSLKEAARRLEATDRAGNELMTLGRITRIAGMVYDPKNQDLIIVGQVNEGEPRITLDDFVVALRAVLVHHKYLLVSIDRTPETATTRKQAVRFEGGIENTTFGEDMLEADIILKKLALGILSAEIWGVRSYFSMSVEHAQRGRAGDHMGSRFWFRPVRPSLWV